MHSLLFTLTDITNINAPDYHDYLVSLPTPTADDLHEAIQHHADYVSDNSSHWGFDDLMNVLEQHDYIEILDREEGNFKFSSDASYIAREIKFRLKEAADLIDSWSPDMQLTMTNETICHRDGTYIALLDENGIYSRMPLDKFLLDGVTLGHSYHIMYVNDFHF